MAGNKDLTVRLIGKDAGALNLFDKTSEGAGKTSEKLSSMGTMALGAGTVMAAGLWKAGQASADLTASISTTDQVFGDAHKTIDEFGKTSADSVGLSTRAFHENAAVMGSFIKNMGFSKQETADMSVSLIKMGSDLGAAFNKSPEQAVEALGSAFRGETDPIEQFGVSIKEADIKARIAALGLDTSTTASEKHSKALAIMSLVQEQTADITGQFGREAESVAGKQARMTASMEDAKAKIGEGFVPVMEKVMSVGSQTIGKFSELDAAVGGNASEMLAWVAIGTLTAGAAMKAVSAIGSVASGFSHAAEGVGTMVRSLGTAQGAIRGLSFAGATAGLVAFTYQLQQNADAAKQWANGQTGSGTLPERIAETKKNLDEAKRSLEGYASIDIGDSVHLFGSNEGRAQADKVKELEAALSGLEGQQKSQTNTTDLQKRGVDELGNAIGGTAEETENAKKAFDEATSSMRAFFDEAAGRVDAERNLAQAHDDLSRSIAENGIYFDNMTQQGRDNRAAFQEAGSAAVDWGLKQVEAGANADAAAFAVNLQVESLRQQMYQAGVSKGAVDSYIASLKLTPADIMTQFRTPGLAQGIADVRTLGTALDGLVAKFPEASRGVAAVLNRTVPIGGPAHAAGAYYPARAGGSVATVAEAGQAEWVLPDAKLRGALAEAGGGGVSVVVNVAGSVVAERDLVKAVRNGVITDLRRTGGTPTTYFGG